MFKKMITYVLQVFKQKGEEYRVYGNGGWLWLSASRMYRYVPQDTVGLRGVFARMKARKAEKMGVATQVGNPENSPEKMEVDGVIEKTETEQGQGDTVEKMSIDNQETTPKDESTTPGDTVGDTPEKKELPDKKGKRGAKKSPEKDQAKENMKLDADIELKDKTDQMRTDLIDVSQSLIDHSFYPKLNKPPSKLDVLLDRRTKQDEYEKKQRSTLEQLIAKHKLDKLKKKEGIKSENAQSKQGESGNCYSPGCHLDEKSLCYSPSCPKKFKVKKEEVNAESVDLKNVKKEEDNDADSISGELSKDSENSQPGDDDEKKTSGEKGDDAKMEEDENSDVDVENDSGNEKPKDTTKQDANKDEKSIVSPFKAILGAINKEDNKDSKLDGKSDPPATTPGSKPSTSAATPKGSLSASSPALALLAASGKLEELMAKIPKPRTTNEKVYLARFMKIPSRKKQAVKKTNLPVCTKFVTKHGKRSIFILEKLDLRKLCRKGGFGEAPGFNYNCKMNNVNWIYPCPRPSFRTSWRYRTQTLKSLAGACTQLRILWSCIRWDDMLEKPPQGGTNTTSTETEITTMELLKRRDIGSYGLRSEFLVRKIIVPIGVTQKPTGRRSEVVLNMNMHFRGLS